LPYDCDFFSNAHRQYEDYCRQRNVVPFQGFRTMEDMRLFHCGFWLNFASVPKKAPAGSAVPAQAAAVASPAAAR
jgi:hypothetical protein